MTPSAAPWDAQTPLDENLPAITRRAGLVHLGTLWAATSVGLAACGNGDAPAPTPSPPAPTGGAPLTAPVLAAGSRTGNSVTINITWGSGVANWTPQYRPASSPTWIGFTAISSASATYTFGGLVAASNYDFRLIDLASGLTSNVLSDSTTEAGTWPLAAGHFEIAKIPLEIIAPRAGLSTANRYYKQYPGIPYRVPVVVLGGAYPFRFELIAAPAGMTIGQHPGDTDYGVIQWPLPVDTGSPQRIEARVTDQQGNTATVAWSLSVTTAGFMFLDAVNGSDGNPGTLSAPKKTINGWSRQSYTDDTFRDYHCIYRTGVYAAGDGLKSPADYGTWLQCGYGRKPKVHMAYPGEAVTLDTTSNSILYLNGTSNDIWFSGFTAAGMGSSGMYHWVEWDSGPSDIGFFENTFLQPVTPGPGGTNAALVMSRANAPGQYIFMVGNTFGNMRAHCAFLGYHANKCVFENNTFTGSNDGNGFFAKELCNHWSVRNNTGLANNSSHLFGMQNWGGNQANFDISHNNYQSSGDGININLGSGAGALSNIWSRRNTWQIAQHALSNISVAGFEAVNDVTRYTNGAAPHGWVQSGGTLSGTFTGEECVGTADYVTPSTGRLVGSYRANYLGRRGHELA